jgi:hypothetical protein
VPAKKLRPGSAGLVLHDLHADKLFSEASFQFSPSSASAPDR